MKTNYGEVIEKIESKKAKDRLKTKSIFQENQGFPASENIFLGRKPLKTGKSSDLTGKEIGISGPTFSKGYKKITKKIK
jgi:hypothetical protein